MDEKQVEAILRNPGFQDMVARKSRLSWILTAIMLFVYVGFMLLVGYDKALLMRPLNGTVITLGIPLGLGIIVLSFLLCGVYAYITNHQLDQLTQDAIREVEAIADEQGKK
ncbi:DUF485 domain-containing protein [Acinetobacter sp. WZC-1]|uniref:DUF485 domain-containing protein n=1 Tax=Acinetobacter sp. WZC-1 TaxID=3459034 RepID=UPI00403DB5F0